MATQQELIAEAQRRGLIPSAQPTQDELMAEAVRRGLAPDPSRIGEPRAKPEQLTEAQQGAADILGLDPNITERGLIAPFGRTAAGETEFAMPQIAIEALEAALLPGQALRGGVITPEDVTRAAATFGPGALRGAGVVSRAARQAAEAAPGQAGAQPGRQSTFAAQPAAQRPRDTIKGLSPEQAARAARFQEQGIPATRGDVTQGFAQQAEEQRLISMATGAAGEPLRQRKLEQSEAFISSVNSLVDDLGVPTRTGDSVKEALTGRKALLRSEKNALYKEVGEAAPEVANVPILTDGIEKVLPKERDLRRLRRLSPNTVDAVDDLLVEFGINKNPVATEAFIKSGGEITPLNLGNSEEFRQALGQIDRADLTGATKVITGPIRNALDEEAVFIDDALKASGLTDQGIIGMLKEARSGVRTIKTEFSPQAITGRLIDVKRDGVTPVIEASRVTLALLRQNAPIENLRRTLQSLSGSGAKGKRAINDMQASVVMDALEAALKAPSRKTSGIETIGGNQFANALSKFGDDKLDLLFAGNKKALNSLRNLKQTALDITPTAGAVPRGSAPVILDIGKRMGRLPGLAAAVDAITFVTRAGADDRAVAKALKSKPAIENTLRGIRRDFPTIAERLGLAAILSGDEPDQIDDAITRAGII